MDNEMTRRFFLASIIGTLVGAPVAVRLLGGKRGTREEYRFTKLLKQYRTLSDVAISPTSAASPFSLPLKPPIGGKWKYVLYSPTFLPTDLSQAVGDEPDMFYAAEGILFIDQMNRGQIVLTGGDTFVAAIAPTGVEEKTKKTISLLVKDRRLVPAKVQGQSSPAHADLQFLHLLTSTAPQSQKGLTIGTKWKSDQGRIKPFTSLKTDYEVIGFAEITGRTCVDIAYSGRIPNLLELPGVRDQKPDKGAVSEIQYDGHDWFDLETGFLVRQELHMESRNSGIVGYKGRDGSDSMTIKSDTILQILQS